MKKLAILIVLLLVLTSSFPYPILAMGNTEDQNSEESESNRKQIDDGAINDLDNQVEGEAEDKNNDSNKDKEGNDKDKKVEDKKNSSKNNKSFVEKKETTKNKEETINPVENKSNKHTTKAKDDADKSKEEYNDLGIKIGTKIYGEDISELSEEELQYVPKAWRDGDFKSEHPDKQTSNDRNLLMRAAYPDVNSYIHNITPAKVEYNHKSIFPKFNYRNGFGKPEGIVAHETANPGSSITNEINYMTKNYNNAFVHAFVDHSHIIEIHPTDYAAWGAGRFANERFIHVELVEVNNFDQFARSINNYSTYIASLLYKYNLGVSSAEKNGKGTLWSHKAVSKFLGGTTHVDPHGYFAKYGYNWNQFVSLVTSKYNKLVEGKSSNTSKLGHIKSSNAKIYDNPSKKKGSTAGSKNMNEVFYIKAEAKINGVHYYLISREPSSKKGTVGWVKASDINVRTHNCVDKRSKTFIVKGSGKAYDKAWGGSKNLIFDLSSYSGSTFKVNLTEAVGNNTWYRGTLNGKVVWIHSSYLATVTESNISKLGHIHNENVTIFRKIFDDSNSFKSGNKYTNSVYYIKKHAKANGKNFYLISLEPSREKGVVGWVEDKNMSVHTHKGVDTNSKTFTIKGDGKAYNKAWGGSRNLVYDLSKHKGTTFKVNLTESVGNNTWYRGILNGKQVWIHSSYVIDKRNTSKLGHIRDGKVKIYSSIYADASSFAAGEKYTNQVYYIKEQSKVNKQLYYLISLKPSRIDGTVGWVKAEDLSLHTHKGVDKKNKTFYFTGKGSAYKKAWGGSKDLVYKDMGSYKSQAFHVNLTEKVGNNTWFRGKFNGKTVWLHESYLTTKEESHTSKLGHIRSDKVNIYKTIGDSSSVFSAGEEYTNQVYYIKQQAKIGKQTFYLISLKPSRIDGVVGWVNAKDLSTHDHIGVDKKVKTFYFTGKGNAYTKAWGGSKDLVYPDMTSYKGQRFNVDLTEKVGNNVWYRGQLNGKTMWLHSSFV
ncbi:hypothetical protein F3157_21960 [Virgibacillus dakarensis]|nr:hypothetical protein [Virgibacillus dakarensis]